MHRFYADTVNCVDSVVSLPEEDVRHACTVLRMKPGQQAEIILDDGSRWSAELLSVSPKDVRLRLLSLLPSTEPSVSVTLYQGLPKSDKMDLIMQKAVELGVSRIVPVLMERWKTKRPLSDSSGFRYSYPEAGIK